MTEPRDLSNPFDRDRHPLDIQQIRKLCFVLGGMYDLHPLPKGDNVIHPTFQICPATFIRFLIVRLTEATRQDKIRIVDVRLAGGAASQIINPNFNDFNMLNDRFNDLDFVFNLEVDESTDHAAAYDRIRDICVECLRQFSPLPVQNLSLVEFAKLYVFKQMRIMCSKDEDNCWVLVSTNNKYGKTIDMLFIHKMRRRFIFPTDSFRIILEDSFLAMVQHARESVQSPSCAHIASVAMHVQPPPMSISTPAHLDADLNMRMEEAKQNGHHHPAEDEPRSMSVERLAHIHPSPHENNQRVESSERSTTEGLVVDLSLIPGRNGELENGLNTPVEMSLESKVAQQIRSEDEHVQQQQSPPERELLESSRDQTRSGDVLNGVPPPLGNSGENGSSNTTMTTTPGKTNGSPPTTSKTEPQTPKGRGRTKRRRRRKKRNSQSQSRLEETMKREQVQQRSAGSAPPAEVPPNSGHDGNRENGAPSPSNESVRNASVGMESLSREEHGTHRRGVSLDGANHTRVDRSVFFDGDDSETRKAQSLPPTFETETTNFGHRAETPPSRAYMYGQRPVTVNMSVQTDGSFYEDDNSSRRGSGTNSTASMSPRSVATSASGMSQCIPSENNPMHRPNWNAWVTPLEHPDVYSLALFEEYDIALEDLMNQRIRFHRPEEVRGGGLLKYCELLQRGYKLCGDQEAQKLSYEQLILNRFVNIDYVDPNEQRSAITTFLMRHFRHRTVEAVHFLFYIKTVVAGLQALSKQYTDSAAALLEIVETLDSALREAVRTHTYNHSSVSNGNGSSQHLAAQAARRLQQAQQAQVQAQKQQHQHPHMYSAMHSYYQPSLYNSSNAHAMYPIYRHSFGMLAQAQYHYPQHWGRQPVYPHQQSTAFISVPALGSYGGFGRNHRSDYESKEDEMPSRRRKYGRTNQRNNGHQSARYGHNHGGSYSHSRSRVNGRHGKPNNS